MPMFGGRAKRKPVFKKGECSAMQLTETVLL